MTKQEKNKKIKIFDTTLRDGEQSPGATMNTEEKLLVAKQLERLGVDTIEAGFAAASSGDFDSVRKIANALHGPMIVSLCRTQEKDIDLACKALSGTSNWGIHTFIATSDLHLKVKLKIDRKTAIEKAVSSIERARKHTENIEFSAEDATRSDPNFLIEIFSAAVRAGATVLNVPDTVGYTTPNEMYQLIDRLKNDVYQADSVIFSVHCHNDLGLAVANSLAAIQAGARQVECTINGIGERAGNTAMEEIAMILQTRKNYYDLYCGIKTDQIYQSSRLLTQITGMLVQPNKAIVGANAFAHEAGIHQDGIIKNRLTYEIMEPASIGLVSNQLILGKHSGRAALNKKIQELGFEVLEEELNRVFIDFKKLADRKKNVYDEDIERLVTQRKIRVDEKYKLVDLIVSSGTHKTPEAIVTLSEDGVELEAKTHSGDGPVDAALNTIKEITGISCKLVSYNVKSITGGTDAQGEVSVTIETDGRRFKGNGAHTDIVIASALAFINAINRFSTKKYQPRFSIKDIM